MGETEDERVETPAEASESAKGDLSYHYWHARANAGDAPAATAKKITSEEAEALSRQVSSTQISAWNSAGTWEERGHTDWAKARLEALVVERGTFDLDGAFEGRKVEIVGVKKCEGDASVVMIRGKPRHGFDFETTLEWRATFEAEREKSDAEDDDDDDDGSVEVCGTISIPEFSRDCAEDEECGYEIQFNSRKSELRTREDACFAALKKRVESFLVDAARQIDGELQQRASA